LILNDRKEGKEGGIDTKENKSKVLKVQCKTRLKEIQKVQMQTYRRTETALERPLAWKGRPNGNRTQGEAARTQPS
jgi:hypothetical protein